MKMNLESNIILKNKLYQNNYIPEIISWDLTYRCVNNCIHCYQHKVKSKKINELSFERICEILDELYNIGCIEILFSGGEPFVFKKFLDILEYASNLGFIITIFSSGSVVLNESMIRKLEKIKVSQFEFTILGHNPEEHDKITNHIGSYDIMVDNIKKLKKIDKNVILKNILTKNNFDYIDEIENNCKGWGCEYHSSSQIWSPWFEQNSQIHKLKINSNEFEKVFKNSIRKQHNNVKMCNAGYHKGAISPEGFVKPCSIYLDEYNFGSISNNSFAECWDSKIAQEFRLNNSKKYPVNKCIDCNYSEFCEICPALSTWSGDISKPNIELCNETIMKKNIYEKYQK